MGKVPKTSLKASNIHFLALFLNARNSRHICRPAQGGIGDDESMRHFQCRKIYAAREGARPSSGLWPQVWTSFPLVRHANSRQKFSAELFRHPTSFNASSLAVFFKTYGNLKKLIVF
jgi:hypothetical protein